MTEEEIKAEMIARGVPEADLNRLLECRMQIVNLKKEVYDILEKNLTNLHEKQ